MLEAIRGLGFRPSLDGAVSASADAPAMKVTARAGAAGYAGGSDGAISVTLEPKAGQPAPAKTKVRVVPADGITSTGADVEVAALTERRDVSLPLKVAKNATAGARTVTVQVTTERPGEAPRTVELRVPVTVQ